jgi:Family of unknown function (DUF6152)
MKIKTLGLAVIALAVHSFSASAHHSFATFDAERQITLQGIVKEFQWTSPHAWVILAVDDNGRSQRWAIQMNGPSGLVREGWQPKTLLPGMPVTMTIRPLRDGTNGGQLIDVTLPDGTVMGTAEATHRLIHQ